MRSARVHHAARRRGGGVAACRARAQQRERVRRVGVFMNFAADDAVAAVRIRCVPPGIGRAGWTVGRNLRIEYRWAAGNADVSASTPKN